MSRFDWERASQRDKARPERPEQPVVAWWLTPARKGSICGSCSEPIPGGAAAIFRWGDKMTLCGICADARGIVARPSRKWMRSQQSSAKPKRKNARRSRTKPVRAQQAQPTSAVDEIARRIDGIGKTPPAGKSGRRARQAPRGSGG